MLSKRDSSTGYRNKTLQNSDCGNKLYFNTLSIWMGMRCLRCESDGNI